MNLHEDELIVLVVTAAVLVDVAVVLLKEVVVSNKVVNSTIMLQSNSLKIFKDWNFMNTLFEYLEVKITLFV